MLKSRRCFPWANGINHASPSAALPSQRGSIACHDDWLLGPWVGSLAWPRPGRAWDARKSSSHRQRQAKLSRPALGFGGVFFQPASKTGNSFVAGLDVAIDRTLQDETQPLQPVACLTAFSDPIRPRFRADSGHPFRCKPATVPEHSGHPPVVA